MRQNVPEGCDRGTDDLANLAGYDQDYVTFLKERSRELKLMQELGLPLPPWLNPGAVNQPLNAAREPPAKGRSAARQERW